MLPPTPCFLNVLLAAFDLRGFKSRVGKTRAPIMAHPRQLSFLLQYLHPATTEMPWRLKSKISGYYAYHHAQNVAVKQKLCRKLPL